MTDTGSTDKGDLSDNAQTKKDESYSPSSGRETEAMQDEQVTASDAIDPDIDLDAVNVLPGTGGPDDTGDVEEPEDYSREGNATPLS